MSEVVELFTKAFPLCIGAAEKFIQDQQRSMNQIFLAQAPVPAAVGP